MLKLALLISSLNTTVTIQFCFFLLSLAAAIRDSLFFSLFSYWNLLSSTVFLSVSHTSKSTFTLRFQYRFQSSAHTERHSSIYVCTTIHKPYVRLCVCLVSVRTIYILSYVSMFYKFIWYNTVLSLLFTHSCGFPLRNYRLKWETPKDIDIDVKRDRKRERTRKMIKNKIFFIHFSSFFLKNPH